MIFRKVMREELPRIREIFDGVMGTRGCTWSEHYPTDEHIAADLEADGVWGLELDGILMATITVEHEAEHSPLFDWRVRDGRERELARLAVALEHHGHGYAAVLLGKILDMLRAEGASAVHLLVAPDNIAAITTYRRFGFEYRDICTLYEDVYHAYELVF